MESFFPAEETVKKGLSEARKKQQNEEKITRLEALEKTYQEGLKAKAEEVPYEGVPKNIQEAMKSGEGFVHKK